MQLKTMLLPFFPAFGAFAVTDLPAAPTDTNYSENCASLHQIARSTMEARQSGVPMADMMDSAERHMQGNWQRIAQQLIQEAYSQPRYSTNAKQLASTSAFADAIRDTCMAR